MNISLSHLPTISDILLTSPHMMSCPSTIRPLVSASVLDCKGTRVRKSKTKSKRGFEYYSWSHLPYHLLDIIPVLSWPRVDPLTFNMCPFPVNKPTPKLPVGPRIIIKFGQTDRETIYHIILQRKLRLKMYYTKQEYKCRQTEPVS